ncbi:hypothetical protein B0H17DRAFT_1218408 [Mycena rosella]|uniref:Uncharacterized protein n=1 Tax=Mycena rosella TaxID=1033263 RepID=A0AAD7FM18_MYCRO|nr:hypothetical protein B0H17DRAFT_1218408 [Mycena rosella]
MSKWLQTAPVRLKAAGFYISGDMRHLYDANLRYTSLSFSVPAALAAKLPIPEAQKKIMIAYAYLPHHDASSAVLMLGNTDNNTMHLIIGNTVDAELPRSAPDVVPFIAGFHGYSRPIPVWVIEAVEILGEKGNPTFNNIKISFQSYVQYHRAPLGAIPSTSLSGTLVCSLIPSTGKSQGCAKVMINGIALNALLHTVNSSSTALSTNFSVRYFKNSATRMQALWE